MAKKSLDPESATTQVNIADFQRTRDSVSLQFSIKSPQCYTSAATTTTPFIHAFLSRTPPIHNPATTSPPQE